MEDTQATDQHQQIAGEVEEEKVEVELVVEQEKEEDALLLFPSHLSDTLRELHIYSSELILGAPPTLPNGHNKGGVRGGEGGWLKALHSLQTLGISRCPKFLSAYRTSVSSSCCPFPSSLQNLSLYGLEGMDTFEPFSNLTSLTRLYVDSCGEDLRWEGLWPLHTRGQLSELVVSESPNFFVGWDPMRDEQEQLRLSRSSKLRDLTTDDVAGVLVAPICSLLSSSLTKLVLGADKEVERFTKEQEEALHLLNSLQELEFLSWYKLQCLPAGLKKLTNLKRLEISDCPAIRSMPKDALPRSLQELDVRHCENDQLKQRCRRLMGTIPKIRLEYVD